MINSPIRRAWLFLLDHQLGIAFERADGSRGKFATIDPWHPEFKSAFKAMSLTDQRTLRAELDENVLRRPERRADSNH